MKILIAGNLGYIGPAVTNQLRNSFPNAEIIGFDIGYFAPYLTNATFLEERKLNQQIFGDIREFPDQLLEGVDIVLNLAAISNDPMGNKFEEITLDINYKAAVELARKAQKAGVKAYTYASSCSIYGSASEYPKKESDNLNPLTAYARSKVYTENDLVPFASPDFKVTCLRFATACGFTSRLRLDLVLNDFVAGAFINKQISILSDGTPWRPLINAHDMARAFEWSIIRDAQKTGNFLVINTGSNDWNYQIKSLAEAVAELIPGVVVSVNHNAEPDKRSYRVNFDLFRSVAPSHQPLHNLTSTIEQLISNLQEMGFNDVNYRQSHLIRLHVLNNLLNKNMINQKLQWIS
ncbi:MAG: NAD-dependent epimerase/dehydratase family protein [Cyclobacteriaceae bacterium]